MSIKIDDKNEREKTNNHCGRYFFAFFCALIACFALSVCAARTKQKADAVWQNTTICLTTPLSVTDAERLAAAEQELSFTAWRELDDQMVTDPDLGRSVRANVLEVCGAAELVLPLAHGLSADNEGGCLIGEQTAWELFGGTQVVGDVIRVGGRERTICGVLKIPGDIVVVTGGSAYNRITVDSKKAEDGESFLMQNSLSGTVIRLDYLCGMGWFAELVPGKWSDFSGWRNNFSRMQQSFAFLSQTQKSSPEAYYESLCLKYRWCVIFKIQCISFIICFATLLPRIVAVSSAVASFLVSEDSDDKVCRNS